MAAQKLTSVSERGELTTIMVIVGLGVLAAGAVIASLFVSNRQSNFESRSRAQVGHAPTTVEFHIPPGSGLNNWNNQSNMLTVYVGDTVRIYNNDNTSGIPHRLHTGPGGPCPHGMSDIPVGQFYDCVIASIYDPTVAGPWQDHTTHQAQFWVKAVEAPVEVSPTPSPTIPIPTSTASPTLTATPIPLTTPTNVSSQCITYSGTSSAIRNEWDGVTNAKQYGISRRVKTDNIWGGWNDTFAKIAHQNITPRQAYVDYSANEPGKAYQYKIRTCSDDACLQTSDWSTLTNELTCVSSIITATPTLTVTPQPSNTPAPTITLQPTSIPPPSPTPTCGPINPPTYESLQPRETVAPGEVTMTWNTVPGAVTYPLRINDLADDWVPARTGMHNVCDDLWAVQNNTDPTKRTNLDDVCINNLTNNSFRYTFKAGHRYDWWVHAVNSCGTYSSRMGLVTSLVEPTIPPSPTPIPGPGLAVNPTSINVQIPKGTTIPNVLTIQSSGATGFKFGSAPNGSAGPSEKVLWTLPNGQTVNPGQMINIVNGGSIAIGITVASDYLPLSSGASDIFITSNVPGSRSVRIGPVNITYLPAPPSPTPTGYCTSHFDCQDNQYCISNQCTPVVCTRPVGICQYQNIVNHHCEILNKSDGFTCPGGTCLNGICIVPSSTPIPPSATPSPTTTTEPTVTPTITPYPCPRGALGNLDCSPDGLIDTADFELFRQDFGKLVRDLSIPFNHHSPDLFQDDTHQIDTADYEILRSHYGTSR